MNDEYYLDCDDAYTVDGPSADSGTPPRWGIVPHTTDRRSALFLIAGDVFRLKPVIKIVQDSRFYIRYSAGLKSISEDGCEIEIRFISDTDSIFELVSLPIKGGIQPLFWRDLSLDLSFLSGSSGVIEIEVNPGRLGDPTADWVAISELCVATNDKLSRVQSLNLHELRIRNEIEHFSSTYRHNFYGGGKSYRSIKTRSLNQQPQKGRQVKCLERVLSMPAEGEATFDYASRILQEALEPFHYIDFLKRLKLLGAKKNKLRVLSLCSGAARIESSFAAAVGKNVEWSLLDVNADLLGMAASKFPQDVVLDLIEANVNKLTATDEKWDVILCISALHHVVELERVIRFCHESLVVGGEFWSIGEYVGRNGNRLWRSAANVANEVFQNLPTRYRWNRFTETIDEVLPDNDYSVGCFEGIRSEEIEQIIGRWFRCEDITRRNSFLWRLVNLAYAENYDLSNADDVEIIKRMVTAEANYFIESRDGTELNAVYRPIYN